MSESVSDKSKQWKDSGPIKTKFLQNEEKCISCRKGVKVSDKGFISGINAAIQVVHNGINYIKAWHGGINHDQQYETLSNYIQNDHQLY